MAKTSRHGAYRLRKRQGISKKCVSKKVEEALEYGIDRVDVGGRLRRYLDKQNAGRIANIKVYKGYVYIFRDRCLVTCYSLPSNLRKIAANPPQSIKLKNMQEEIVDVL